MQIELVNILTYIQILSYKNGITIPQFQPACGTIQRPLATWPPMGVVSHSVIQFASIMPVLTEKLSQRIWIGYGYLVVKMYGYGNG